MNKDQFLDVIYEARQAGAFVDDRDNPMFNDEYDVIRLTDGNLALVVRLNWVHHLIAEYDGLTDYQARDPHHARGNDAERILQFAVAADARCTTGTVRALKNHLEVYYVAR